MSCGPSSHRAGGRRARARRGAASPLTSKAARSVAAQAEAGARCARAARAAAPDLPLGCRPAPFSLRRRGRLSSPFACCRWPPPSAGCGSASVPSSPGPRRPRQASRGIPSGQVWATTRGVEAWSRPGRRARLPDAWRAAARGARRPLLSLSMAPHVYTRPRIATSRSSSWRTGSPRRSVRRRSRTTRAPASRRRPVVGSGGRRCRRRDRRAALRPARAWTSARADAGGEGRARRAT